MHTPFIERTNNNMAQVEARMNVIYVRYVLNKRRCTVLCVPFQGFLEHILAHVRCESSAQGSQFQNVLQVNCSSQPATKNELR